VTRLRVPDLLRGAEWEHALVLTYSLDLTFYERDLGRTLARVPNRVVLADGAAWQSTLTTSLAAARACTARTSLTPSPA